MKILVQDTKTRLYLSGGGCWSDNPEGALAFLDEIRAMDFIIYHRLLNTKVVVLLESGGSQNSTTTVASPAKTNLDN